MVDDRHRDFVVELNVAGLLRGRHGRKVHDEIVVDVFDGGGLRISVRANGGDRHDVLTPQNLEDSRPERFIHMREEAQKRWGSFPGELGTGDHDLWHSRSSVSKTLPSAIGQSDAPIPRDRLGHWRLCSFVVARCNPYQRTASHHHGTIEELTEDE